MRLFTTKRCYRAFPELDHFSDAQCSAFVAAAKGTWFARLARAFAQAFAGFVLFYIVTLGVVVPLSYVFGFGGDPRDRYFDVIAIAGMLIGLGSASFAILRARDLFLRSRIRRVMQSRGSCNACGYGLTGLHVVAPTPPGDGPTPFIVTCPECGVSHAVDAALGETVSDANGTLRYMPSPNAPGMLKPGIVDRFVRRNAKLALVATGLVLFLLAASAGGYEAFIRAQAARAREQILSPEQLRQILAEAFPNLPGHDHLGEPHPFERLQDLAERIEEIRRHASVDESGVTAAINMDAAAPLMPDPTMTERDREFAAEQRPAADRFVALLTREGLFEELDAIASTSPRLPPVGASGKITLDSRVFFSHGATILDLLRMNRARIRTAILDGNPGVVSRALRTHMLLVEHAATVPTASSQNLAQRQHAAAIQLAVSAMAKHRSDEWLHAISEPMSAPLGLPARAQFLVAEQAFARSVTCSIFANPENVRFGRYSPRYRGWIDDASGVVVGTLAGATRELETLYKARRDIEDMDYFQRPIAELGKVRHAANLYMLGDAPSWLSASDTYSALTRAFTVFLAIEQFRLDHTRLPATLSELQPRYLASIPLDPFSGKPLGYTRDTDSNAPNSYAIYSTGVDQFDQGGIFPPIDRKIWPLKLQFPDTPLIVMPPRTPPD